MFQVLFGSLFAGLLTSLTFLGGCDLLPWLESDVGLPGSNVVQVMIRAGGTYQTAVTGPNGSISWYSPPIAGGHRHANLYFTPENWLVIIDAGGVDSFVRFPPGHAPVRFAPLFRPQGALWSSDWRYRAVMRRERSTRWSSTWRYLGAVTRHGDELRFVSSRTGRECLPVGEKDDSPYRLRHQSMHGCPND